MKKFLKLFLVLTMVCTSLLVACKPSESVDKFFYSGIYEGRINGELTSIYVFYSDGEGGTEFNLDGNGIPFAYEVKYTDKETNETMVLFHMGDAGDNTYVKAKAISDTEYNLGVYTLKLVEKDTSEQKVDEVLNKYSK